MKPYLVVDVETVPIEPPNKFVVDYFMSHKWDKLDSDKVEETIKIDMSTHPALARLSLIGIKSGNEIVQFDGDEDSMLYEFWTTLTAMYKEYNRVTFVTFNGIDFDFPFIEFRSNFLTDYSVLKTSKGETSIFNLPKNPWNLDDHFDIRVVLSNHQRYALGTLLFYGKLFGIDVDDELAQVNIYDLWLKNGMAKIKEHNHQDLVLTEKLFHKVRLGQIPSYVRV